MLYVRRNNCDTDDAEYYVNHLMVAVLRELDGDTLLYYHSKPLHDGSVITGCRRRDCLRKIKNRGSAWIAQRASIFMWLVLGQVNCFGQVDF